MTEPEWMASDWPSDMLRHLDGKIDDKSFMHFSVGCCRRIWPLMPDSRSQAVVEATEAYLAGELSPEACLSIVKEWASAYENGAVHDLAGGSTNEAIESVCGIGFGHASQVAKACFESAGYWASENLRSDAPESEKTGARLAAETQERQAQCQLLRQLFGYRSASAVEND